MFCVKQVNNFVITYIYSNCGIVLLLYFIIIVLLLCFIIILTFQYTCTSKVSVLPQLSRNTDTLKVQLIKPLGLLTALSPPSISLFLYVIHGLSVYFCHSLNIYCIPVYFHGEILLQILILRKNFCQ